MKPYQYRCKDYSLLTPYLRQYVCQPLLPLIPWAIPANIITIISNIFIFIALYISFTLQSGNLIQYVAIALCLILYLIGDHLDGMQAKRTSTGSALGEFCDHYFDTFNNGILLMITINVFEITNHSLIAYLFTASYVAHAAVFYEQYKTGWLIFEKVGSMESVLLLAILIVLSAFEPFRNVMQTLVYQNYNLAESLFILTSFGAVITATKTLLRINKETGQSVTRAYIMFCVWLAMVGMASSILFPSWATFVIMTLYGSHYIGNLMRGHLVDDQERYADLIVPILLVVKFSLILPISNEMFLFGILLYQMAAILWIVVMTVRPLSVFWVWKNPKNITKV
jgi:ethanolaminephosphotransferase